MTRAEAARHASLVRWKKETALGPQTGGMSNPKIRARVAEILAAKQKGKAKAKGGKGKAKAAKPKGTKQEQANQNRASVAKQTGMGDLEGTLVRVAAGMARGGEDLEPEAHNKLIEKGLAKRHADGSVTLSPAGRKWKSAADKGDADGANAALNDARAGAADSAAKEQEKTAKKAEREKAKQAKLTERAAKQKKQQQAQKQKAQARAKIKAAKEKARAAKEKAKAQPKATKAMTVLDTYIQSSSGTTDMVAAIKAGARHSRMDQQHIQAIHDSAVACGADCATDDEGDDDEMDMDGAEKAIKGIMDNPLYYAQHECGDIMQAANALSTMAMLIQSELMEEDEDDAHIALLCDGARTLVKFISAELDELEGAAGDAADDARMGPMKAIQDGDDDLAEKFLARAVARHKRHMNGTEATDDESQQLMMDDMRAALKAIAKRENVNPKAGVAEYGNVTFADAKNKKYPIDTADHVRAAWSYANQEKNAAKYAPDEIAQIKAKIVSAWKKLIDKAGPPSAGKAVDDAWLHIEGDAIKALDNDVIRGYAVRFGDSDHADLQKDYYTKSTDFWLDHFGWPRPITYHHGMDAGTRNDPVIGHWLKAGVDDVGVWMEGQMDRAHAYYKAMKELAQRGYLRLSSDSAPQWVIRERQQNGVNEIKRWPLVTSSVTVTPMEPRMLPVEVKAYLAEIGMDIDDSPEAINPELARSDATKASDDERARRLLLELELLELETA